MQETLLIELLTEELPPKALATLGQVFAQTVFDELVKLQLVGADVELQPFASPRRLAVRIPAVSSIQPEQQIERKGPAVASGMKDGQPTPALQGFARSCGVDVSVLQTMSDGKQDVFVFRSSKPGAALASLLPDVLTTAIKKLPIPKVMRWGDTDVQFVRPVKSLIVLLGNEVLPVELLGLTSGRVTRGHRFLSSGELTIAHADDYARVLFEDGKVVASVAARKSLIEKELSQAAASLNATIGADVALIDEVAALVEWPVVYVGRFEDEFLKVPQECLMLTMQQNQKYFPLLDAAGKLLPTFLVVSNLKTDDPSHIIQGNERVLRARLSDARFFFEQDQKTKLDNRVARLADVVYHNKLGSQLERIARLQTLAGEIAALLGADRALAARAAYLAKADLVSDMVGEFPELQGIMGRYYAQIDGEHAEVADAIEGHYHPRFAGDALPQGHVALSVALADKLETLVGIYGIGLIPTGDKDPFALRRAALGVLRMMVEAELPIDLQQLLNMTASTFEAGKLSGDVVAGVLGFMQDRLRNLLAGEFDAREVDAVLALNPTRLDTIRAKLVAVAEFRALPEAAALAAADKRIRNILKKVEGILPAVDAARLAEAPEKALFEATRAAAPQVNAELQAGNYTAGLKQLASLRAPVDAFFADVMVMAEDMAVRNNRLALLSELAALMNQVAEIALLAE
ncbi:glycine--tRNA ligase subunit beta [Leeia oryzae]|uniref:glycine--tRNA ligase subunit beta n=1 Tax=Leeia oryzae TaxID=356662 RepID=UPI000369D05D|nr:glycine--tRNA ligase subunit beta [Leeia oryzae]